MLDRSVPFYQEIQRMIADMATDFATEGSNIYDLGCSTGNTLLNLDAVAGEDRHLDRGRLFGGHAEALPRQAR